MRQNRLQIDMARSFLISRLSSLGDVVCSLPAAAALKRAFPDCTIDWLASPVFAALAEACPYVDRTFPYKFAFSKSLPEGLADRYEAAFDLQGLLKSAWPVKCVKAGEKLGYHWQREGSWLFTRPVTPDSTSLHVTDQYVDVVRAVGGIAADEPERTLEPNPEASASVAEKLREAGVPERFVAINAGAAWATKRWPAEKFAWVADRLQESGLGVVLIGAKTPGDLEAAEALCQAASIPPISMLGQTNVAELVALIDRAAAHIGGDTGSTHIAAALLKPAIGLYSITRPERSCPYGQRHRTHYDPDSLANIPPESVLETVMEALGQA